MTIIRTPRHHSDRLPRQRTDVAGAATSGVEGLAARVVRYAAAALRLSIGWVFVWAFLDKAFGLGHDTAGKDAWVHGGSPTKGFLAFGADGPFKDFYHSIAGAAWADWLFMIGLLGIGIALTFGVGMRIAAVAGAALYVLMWSVVLPPVNNPVIDEHILGAITVVALALVNAGDTWGLGRWWTGTDIVTRCPALR